VRDIQYIGVFGGRGTADGSLGALIAILSGGGMQQLDSQLPELGAPPSMMYTEEPMSAGRGVRWRLMCREQRMRIHRLLRDGVRVLRRSKKRLRPLFQRSLPHHPHRARRPALQYHANGECSSIIVGWMK